jgi:hypothetical protein
MSDPSANGNSLANTPAAPLAASISASNFELDSASEWSDTSSLDGSMSGATTPILHRNFPPPSAPTDYSAGLAVSLSTGPTTTASREQMQRLVERLQQENRVLKMEVETQKMRIKSLQEENKGLRQQSVMIVSFGWLIDWLIDWVIGCKPCTVD